MLHGTYHFSVVAGEGHSFVVTVETAAGTPVNLVVGTTARWAMWRDPATLVADFDLDDGLTILDLEDGTILVTLPGDDTADLSGRYVHELKVRLPDTEPDTVLSGTGDFTPSPITLP